MKATPHISESEGSKNRGGRRPRYGTRAKGICVYFPPKLLERLKLEKGVRQLREPNEERSASRVGVEGWARLYGFDLTPSEAS